MRKNDIQGLRVFFCAAARRMTASAALALTLSVQALGQTTLYVDASRPDDSGDGLTWAGAKRTIQAAINASEDGDEVVVAAGIYNEGGAVAAGGLLTNRVYLDRNITLRSQDGRDATFIEGAESAATGHGPDAVRCVWQGAGRISGFTLQNGNTDTMTGTYEDRCGGGLYLVSGVAEGLLIQNNKANSDGGGVYMSDMALIKDCKISSNNSEALGGGIYLNTLNGQIERCAVENNTAVSGGGVYLYNGGTIRDSLIAANWANAQGGVVMKDGSQLINCTVAKNNADADAGGVAIMAEVSALIANSIIWHNFGSGDISGLGIGSIAYSCSPELNHGTDGCITNEPLMRDIHSWDFSLAPESPCFNTGDGSYVSTNPSPRDLYQNPRVAFGAVDMGALELNFIVRPPDGRREGGTLVTITNGVAFASPVTNVLMESLNATIAAQGPDWVRVVMPARHPGPADFLIQSADTDFHLESAYNYNFPGVIGLPGTWEDTLHDLPQPLRSSVAVVHNMMLYVIGGFNGGALSNVYYYNFAGWGEEPSLPAPRYRHGAASFNGKLLVLGGSLSSMGTTNVFAFDGGIWTELPGLPQPLAGMGIGVLNDRLYAVGGENAGVIVTNVYQFDGLTWTEVAGLPEARADLGIGVVGGQLYAYGGNDADFSPSRSFFRFDGTNWAYMPEDMPEAAAAMGTATFQDRLYLIGGYDGSNPMNIAMFRDLFWRHMDTLPDARRYVAATEYQGALYAIGGENLGIHSNVWKMDIRERGVMPYSASATGGMEIVISGRELGNGADITNVALCGHVVQSVVSQSDTQVVVIAASVPGPLTGDVLVQSDKFGDTWRHNAFTYEAGILGITTTNGASITNNQESSPLYDTDFQVVTPGQALTNDFYARNWGNFSLSISGVTTSGPNPDAFEIIWFPASVETNYPAAFRIAFQPSGPGLHEASFIITSSDLKSPFHLNVRGTGEGGGVAFALSTNHLYFSTTYLSPRAPRILSLTNTGNAALAFTNEWSYSADAAGWLTVSPSHGGLPPESAILLTNSVDVSTLNAGMYYATNRVSSGEATNSPLFYDVQLFIQKATQTMSFSLPPGPFAATSAIPLNAFASSGGPITYSIVSGPGQVTNGNELLFNGAGQVEIRASQPGNANYEPVEQIRTADVVRADQMLWFDNPGPQLTTNVVGLYATCQSGLPVSFAVHSGLGSVSGTNLSFTGPGVVVVYASQSGNAIWNAAESVTNWISVNRTPQAPLSFAPSSPLPYMATNPLTASGGSGTGPLSFAILSGPGEIRDESNLVALAGTGIIQVTATKDYDDMFDALAATASVSCARADQTIDFPGIFDQAATNVVPLGATASSGLMVDYSVSGPASLVGGTFLVFSATGAVSVTAHQAGDANYNPAPDVTNSFLVFPAQADIFLADLDQTYDSTPRHASYWTDPAGLTADLTYDGSTNAPVTAGVYQVIANLREPLYTGSATGTLTVARKELTVSGAAADNKTYDGTTNATLSGAVLEGVVAPDVVSLDTPMIGYFAQKNPGEFISVDAALSLTGPDVANYILTQPVGLAADIAPRELTVLGAEAANKTYDASTEAQLFAEGLVGVVSGDNVSLDTPMTGYFDQTSAGNALPVTATLALTGPDALNYTLTQPTNLTADILPKGLTVFDADAYDKVYDGSTNAELFAIGLVGVVGADDVGLETPMSGFFHQATAGTAIPVTAQFVLTGLDIGNYFLTQPTGLAADITTRELTVLGAEASGKVYDASTNAQLFAEGLVGVVPGDTVSLDTPMIGYFYQKQVGYALPVAAALSLTGADAPNYHLTQPEGLAADITPKTLTLTGTQADDKTYDGLTDATVNDFGTLNGIITPDIVSLDAYWADPRFDDPHVGTGKTVTITGLLLTDADSGNYTLAEPVTCLADITPAPQTIDFPQIPNQVLTNRVVLAADASSLLPVEFSLASGPAVLSGGSNLHFTAAGEVCVVAYQNGSADYLPAPPVSNVFTVVDSTAAVTLQDLAQTYDGGPRCVWATTIPPFLAVDILYDGQTNLPVNAGSYLVVGTINDPVYEGASTGVLVVARASQYIFFPSINNQFTTSSVGLEAYSDSGLPVSFEVAAGPALISGTTMTFTAEGFVEVAAYQAGDTNWEAAASVTNILYVEKSMAFVTLSNLNHTYDGFPHEAEAFTEPPNFNVDFSYDGSTVPPVGAGDYHLTATINDPLYQGEATGTFTIAKADQTISSFLPANGATLSSTGIIRLAATASSPLPVSFEVTPPLPWVFLDGADLWFSGTGTVHIAARHDGDDNWNPAPAITNTYTVVDTSPSAQLRVVIEPAAAAHTGLWRTDTETNWLASNVQIPLYPGPVTIEFAANPGWIVPNPTNVVLASGELLVVTGKCRDADMIYLSGGTFSMGIRSGLGGHQVTIGAFLIDAAEVSIGEFQAFCDQTGTPLPTQPWGTANSNLPVVNVSFDQAVAYAAWAGKRLPTEAEWEFAARGGLSDRLYPWGDTPDPARAQYGSPSGNPVEASAFPANGNGLFNTAGNVWEWCQDWYSFPLTGPVTNPVGPAVGAHKVIRGGSFATDALPLQNALRYYYDPAAGHLDLGFRCALSTAQRKKAPGDLCLDFLIPLLFPE